MPSTSIIEVLSGLEIDNAAHLREQTSIKPAHKSYIVLFTPRSGSSWLTSVISATGKLGLPEEYINPEFLRDVARSNNSVDPSGIISSLKRRRKTKNGVFGIEVLAAHVNFFGEEAFFGSFDANVPVFSLWRDNIILQGISLYRAVTTKRFHSSERPLVAQDPEYDPAGIERWINHIVTIENENIQLIEKRNIRAHFLKYEEIIQSRKATIEIFADAMSVDLLTEDLKISDSAELKKIGDNWNDEAECAFRKDMPNFVSTLSSRRRIKLMP